MSSGGLLDELRRLAPYSRRVRAALSVLLRYPTRPLQGDTGRTLRRLIKDIKLRLGEPIEPEITWPAGKVPASFADAQIYLQRPELFETDNFEAMLWHADQGRKATRGRAGTSYVNADLKRFSDRMVKLAHDRKVPLFVFEMWISPDEQRRRYVQGTSDRSPRECPHCYGRGVTFGHAAERTWSGWCLTWINTLGELAAKECGVSIGYGPSAPGEFIIADGNGELGPFDGLFPDPSAVDEAARLFEFYSRGAIVGRVEQTARRYTRPSHGGIDQVRGGFLPYIPFDGEPEDFSVIEPDTFAVNRTAGAWRPDIQDDFIIETTEDGIAYVQPSRALIEAAEASEKPRNNPSGTDD